MMHILSVYFKSKDVYYFQAVTIDFCLNVCTLANEIQMSSTVLSLENFSNFPVLVCVQYHRNKIDE